MPPLGLVEVSRTGIVAVARGPEAMSLDPAGPAARGTSGQLQKGAYGYTLYIREDFRP